MELARASGIERRIIVSNNPGRRFSSVSMATCASRANGLLASVGNRSNTNTVGSLPLSLGEFWWGQRNSGGVGGAKVGRRSPAYRAGTASSARVPRSLPLVAAATATAAALHGARSLREIVSFLLSLLKQSSHDVGGAHRSTLAPNFTLLPPPGGEAKRATGTP